MMKGRRQKETTAKRHDRHRTKREGGSGAGPAIILCAVCGTGEGRYKCPQCRTPFCCVRCSKDHRANGCPPGGDAASSSSPSSSSARRKEEGRADDADTAAVVANDDDEDGSTSVDYSKRQRAKKRRKTTRRRDDNDDDDDDDDYDDEPGWNITPQMKELLHNSTWLRSTLRTEVGIRRLIRDIDGASDSSSSEDDEKIDYAAATTGTNKKDDGNGNDISPRVLALARAKYTHPKFASFIDKLLYTAGVLQEQQSSSSSSSSSSASSLIEGVGIDGALRGHLTLVPVSRAIAASSTTNGQDDDSEQDDNESSSSSSSSDDESSVDPDITNTGVDNS